MTPRRREKTRDVFFWSRRRRREMSTDSRGDAAATREDARRLFVVAATPRRREMSTGGRGDAVAARADQNRRLGAVDGPKPLFRVAADETQGLVAALDRKMGSILASRAGADAGGRKAKAPKEKMSRADKKAKKQAYGR